MIIDLFHNKIVKDTATEAFEKSVNEVLVPLILEKYGEDVERITMYEDYINDELLYEGEWYYPLTVKLVGQDAFTSWIKWPVTKKTFKGSVPYSYVGEGPLAFDFAGFVPGGFADKLQGRAIDYDTDAIAVKIDAVADNPLFLSGKYSQSFVDELAHQITAELKDKLSITGLENSTMEIQLVFAPGTYLEHTSDNVTYRRLLLVDKGCQARDFWIKWTKLDGVGGYKVADHVSADTVKFELGEDVTQKIREKEYRFLACANPNKYQAAMGKKTVTEWRDIIKRALKRGDIKKVEIEEEDELTKQLKAILGQIETPVQEPKAAEEFDIVAALAKSVLEPIVEEPVAEEPVEEAAEEVVEEEIAPEEISIFDTEEVALEAENLELPESPMFFIDESEDSDSDNFEFSFGADEETVTFEEYVEAVPETVEETEPAVLDEEAIRREIEAKIRLEYETRARLEAEREAERLRLEHEKLLEENERLAKIAREMEEKRIAEEEAKKAEEERLRLAEEERQRELEAKKAEEARIRAEIEAQMRLEAKERERVAEAARMAVEEQKRLEAERAEKALREKEEALAREAERLRREEDARRAEDQRRLEEARRREEEERRRREEEEARKKIAVVSKQARLLFRHSVDVNVIKRIKEVVEATLVANEKQTLNIHIKAFPVDSNSIGLEIKLPQNEMELLATMMRALGGASLGITKIIVE